MPNQQHWTAWSPHQSNNRGRQRKPKKSDSVKLDELDQPIGTGPRDGYEAGRLLSTRGKDAVDAICERVAKEGGR
jgi:hypothetical protein